MDTQTEQKLRRAEVDIEVLTLALHAVYRTLDALVGVCLDPSTGNPRTPDRATLMKAKATLPESYANAFNKDRKKGG
jgi:hypothetical protein